MMNKAQMISYLSSIFLNLDSLSEYSIEYGSALLMNLCLRTIGKQEACRNPELTIKILNELIDYDNIQVKTYVNGCLYSLFADYVMREHAQGIGMESQLQYLKQHSDEALSKQIDFVIAKLMNGTLTLKTIYLEDDDEDDEESLDGDEDDDNENDEEDTIDPEEGKVDPPSKTILKPYYKVDQPAKAPKRRASIARAAEKKSSDLTSQQLQSMQIQLPSLESTKKGKLGVITKQEKEEFNFGFSTRPKVPRTPENVL